MQPQIKVALNFVNLVANQALKEIDRLFQDYLKDTPFKGKVKAVGGYPRDLYLSIIKNDPSIEPDDIDLVVNEEGGSKKITHYIREQFGPETISEPVHMGERKKYPIWEIKFNKDITYKGKTYKTEGAKLQFADPQKEFYPDPETRDRETMPGTLEDDLERRDFAVNMLLKDMTTGEFEDLTGTSKKDIEKGILKGHPNVSWSQMFSNDPIRILRLFRFQAKYNWDIPRAILKDVKKVKDRIKMLNKVNVKCKNCDWKGAANWDPHSKEKFKFECPKCKSAIDEYGDPYIDDKAEKELKKIMDYGGLNKAVKLMSLTGVLPFLLPEIEALKGIKQNPKYHTEGDAYRHTLMVLKNSNPGVDNQIAALLHDVGKATTTTMLEDEIHSYGHEEVGAEIAEAVLKRLRFENDTIAKVKKMVRNHMRPHHLGRDSGTKAIRKFIRDVGDELVDSILALARADELGKIPSTNDIPDLAEKIKKVREQAKEPLSEKNILNGKEIMDLLGIPSGTEVGRAKKMLTEIEDNFAEKGEELTKEKAREELLKEFHKRA